MISDTQRCLLSCVSATRRSMWGCSRGIKASVKLRNNPWKEEDRDVFSLLETFSASAHQLQQILPWTNRTCVGWICLCPCGPQEKETQWTDWWIPGLRSGQRWFSPAVQIEMERWFLVSWCTASLGCGDWPRTSVISSLVKLCLGCSSWGAYINSFLKWGNNSKVNKNIFQICTVIYSRTAKGIRNKLRTLARSNSPNESSPQTRSHPSPVGCEANSCCCTGATGCLHGPRLLSHFALSLQLDEIRCLSWVLTLKLKIKRYICVCVRALQVTLTELRGADGDFLMWSFYLFHYSCHSRYCHLMEKVRVFQHV